MLKAERTQREGYPSRERKSSAMASSSGVKKIVFPGGVR
jgi:hypothetical protein